MLLERQGALQALKDALSRVRAGGGEIAMVTGEAGIGKTVLLRAFAAQAGPGVRQLWGACDGLRTPRPLGPLMDLASEAGPAVHAALATGASRDAVFAATLDALQDSSDPIIMVIEDAHWADEATLDLLTFLGRRIASTRALLLISYRDDEVGTGHPLRAVLGDVTASIRSRIALSPLSLRSVAALAATEGVEPAELYRLTAGNPFFVTESLAAQPATLPVSVRDAVLARAARLSPQARRALDACAVVPGRAELWLLDALADSDAVGIDECIHGGSLQTVGDAVIFRHELGRVAVLDAIPPARRRELHRRALSALASPPAGEPDYSRLAHHAEEAADAEAICRCAPPAAANASARGAHWAAVAHLTAALRYADRLPMDVRADLYSRLAHESFITGKPGEAEAAYDGAIECARALGDRRTEGELWARRAGPFTISGRQSEAVASVRTSLEVLEPLGPTPELAFAYGALCTAHMLARELTLAAEWGDRAIDLSGQVERADHLGYALIQSGTALLIAGQDAGLGRLHRGIDMARQSGLDDRVALGLSQLGSGAGEIRRYDLAVPALQEALSWARDHELTSTVVYVTAWLGRCELEQGRWDEAESRLTDLVPRCGGIARLAALTALGRLRARRGGLEVWELLDEALEIAHRTGHLQRLWPIAAARAEAAWHAGRLDDEVDLVEKAHSLAVQLDYPWAISELDFWLWKAVSCQRLSCQRRRKPCPRSRPAPVGRTDCTSQDGMPRQLVRGLRSAVRTRLPSPKPTARMSTA